MLLYRYDTTVENALQLVRAVPVADEEVENAVKSAGDVMELWFKRFVINVHGFNPLLLVKLYTYYYYYYST